MRSSWPLLFVLAACSDSGGATAKADPKDAGPADAAPIDAGEDASSGPSFCTTLDPAPFLCVDFDDGAAPSDVFTKVAGATVEDHALRAQSDGTNDAYVEHEGDPQPPWEHVELGFALRVVDLGADARMPIARLGQHMTDTECRVELELEPSGITVKGGATDVKLTKAIAKGTTARVVLSVETGVDGGKVRANVTIDGQPAIAAPVELACAAFPGPPRATLGRITGAGSADLRFDDVVFDGR